MKILFISHEATLTGAPLVLLNFLKWIKNNLPTWHSDVLFLKGGARLNDFETNSSFCDIFSPYPFKRSISKRINHKIFSVINKDKIIPKNMLEEFVSYGYDMIYCNTIATLDLGLAFKEKTNKKLILHLHELDTIIKLMCPNFDKIVMKVDYFIAVSEAVKETLVKSYHVTPNKISVIRPFIDKNTESRTIEVLTDKTIITIGASGFAHWRKGTVFFLLVAQRIVKMLPGVNVNFQWVGGCSREEKMITESVLPKLGIEKLVTFVGETHEPDIYYNHFDLFLMTSLEDPFPLVCIEMGTKGIPIICFEGAGGSEEWLPKEAVVPYLDVNAMASAAVERILNKDLYKKESMAIKEASSKFRTELQCPLLAEIIEQL